MILSGKNWSSFSLMKSNEHFGVGGKNVMFETDCSQHTQLTLKQRVIIKQKHRSVSHQNF